MPNARFQATWLRWVLLVAAVAIFLLGLWCLIAPLVLEKPLSTLGAGLLGTPMMPLEVEKPAYAGMVAVYVGIFLGSQWLFLMPKGGLKASLADTSRPMALSMVMAALAAAALSAGLLAVLIELPGWWEQLIYPQKLDPNQGRFWPFFLALILLWIVWTVVFFLYWKQGDRYTWTGRIIRGLVAGSILELLITIPAHIYVVKNRECYCARGTYTGLILGGTVLLWTFGPGVALLFLREKNRREKLNA